MTLDAVRGEELFRELSAATQADVRFDDMSRGLFSTDASIYRIEPVGVIFPRSTADVQTAVRLATKYGVPIVPRGGGTSLSGQSIAAGLVLDLSRHLNKILEIDPERRLVRVQAGVVLQQLNMALHPHGLQFGPDVSTVSRAALGGMIGNNSAGSHSLIHGKTIDHVRELNVVLSDGSELVCGPLDDLRLQERQQRPGREGEIYRQFPKIIEENRRDILARYPKLIRRVSGYNLDAFVPEFAAQVRPAPSVQQLDRDWPDRSGFNLARMIVGSEGTLGVVTEAVLHAVPLPKVRNCACLQFDSIDSAVSAVPKILECQPSAVELIDKLIVEMARENLQYRRYLDFVQGDPAALLVVEFSGESPFQVEDGLELLELRMRGQPGLTNVVRAKTPEQREQIWRCREAGAPLLLSIPGARKPIAFVEDAAVDPSKLPEFTRRFRQVLTKHGASGAYYGHASVGCLHIRPLIDAKSAEDLARVKAISDAIAELVLEFKGAMSGEHGDGLARSYHNPRLYGPRLMAAFHEVKRLFDPAGLMNPEKIVGTPSPIDNLRYGPDYQPFPVATHLDFTKEAELADAPSGLGILAAAEMCNGSGVCRKTHTGTMCPSFMATLDEEHSTRGRANALRMALSGQLPAGSLTSQRMYDVMDLCLMCKGCKAECPSNVDVAKLKVEFLAHYYEAHRPPLGTVIQAHVAYINRIGSALAPLANASLGLPGVNWINEWLTGVDHRRSLPRFQFNSFARSWKRHKPAPTAGRRGTVVLLDDCLTGYCEPQIPRAAVTLLERAGYTVQPAGLWCCGRPFISKGLVNQGASLARLNLQKLGEYVDRGWPILGVEPSCLLTFVDEYPDLVPGPLTDKVKRNAHLLDGWLADKVAAEPESLAFQPLAETALLHGHCQQKALVGTGGTKRALGMIPGLSVREVDSGCCGMAGSFGYEHFDVSQQIGRRVLFPAVDAHTGPVLAPGFSCRHQIADGVAKPARHPLELLAERLVSE